MYKVIFLVAAFAAVAFCDSDSNEGGSRGAPLTVVYGGAPSKSSYRPRPAPVVYSKPRYGGDSYEKDNAKYSFAYKVKAGGARGGYGGYGSDSNEGGYGKGYDRTAEFGHAETRDYGKTTGKYFVELPDGRLQTVEYVVDGKSGYVAKVTYSGGAKAAY